MNLDDKALEMVRDGRMSVDEALELLLGKGNGSLQRGTSPANGAGAAGHTANCETNGATKEAAPDRSSILAEIREKLLAICSEIVGSGVLDPSANYFELGMDSFKILRLFHQVSRIFGVEIDPIRLPDFATVDLLAEHLAAVARGGGASVSGATPAEAPPPAACRSARLECVRAQPATPVLPTPTEARGCEIDFGLYFFANYEPGVHRGKYRLLLDAVRFADENGFSSVFSPERHFEDFGGLFPNPAVVNAALATITRQIQIRAGSVVSPLHDSIRIAEDWAVVDNLSDGRAGVSFTYGWQCDDFVLFPDNYLDRHSRMYAQIDEVRRLWRGESVLRVNGLGKEIEVRTYPRPVQKEIPIWVTCAISRESFVNAGKVGANIVTFLLGQGLAELKEKISAYRHSLAENGYDPAKGRVSLLIHTFLGDDLESVKRKVRDPFLKFIRSQAQLARNMVRSIDPDNDLKNPKEMDDLVDIGFARFFGDSGLMGTVESCRKAVPRFKELGADELSCLIDFGLDHDSVMESLQRLKTLKDFFPPSRLPRNLFPAMDDRGRKPGPGGSIPTPAATASRAVPTNGPTNGQSHPETKEATTHGDPFAERLETFRSYFPGGARIPSASNRPSLPYNNGGVKNGAASADSDAKPLQNSATTKRSDNGKAAWSDTDGYPEIKPEPASLFEPFPLTSVQKAYWMGRDARFELGSTSTHGYLELNVSLDPSRFQTALQKVIDRHPMLRAVVLSGREQRVLPGRLEYQMPVADLSGLSAEEQQKRILEERGRQSHRVFDPAVWPLFDFRMFVLAPGRQWLAFGFDSLIADAASLTIVFREIMGFYHHPEETPPALEFSFRDYMRGYEMFRESELHARDREYWLEKLPSIPPAPEPPLLKAPAEVKKPVFLRESALIEPETWDKVKLLARARMVTPTVALFTAFARVLGRWCHRDEFSLNLTVFNRFPFHPDVNRIVGDFTSLMVVAVELRSGDSFWDTAKAVQAKVFESLGHRHFDGAEVIKELARQRGLLGRAVIPIVFTSNLLNTEGGQDGLSEMGEAGYIITQTTQAYLDNQVAEHQNGLFIAWDYVTELFEPQVIRGMFQDYVSAIKALANPELEPKPAPSSVDEFVENYNDTGDPTIRPTTLASLFAESAAINPARPALEFGDETITYAELDQRSNRVANYLRSRRVGPSGLVGVIAPRCLASIVNTLGVVKSGAAYVPVDPEYPVARQKYILEKARCAVVLDPAICAEIQESWPATPGPCASKPEDLAYVIFTSGSTGHPKGVMITNAAATNTIIDLNRRFAVRPEDRVLGISSMCFDLSVYDVFGSLAAGACLVLIDDIRDPKNLVRAARHRRITIWNSVPALFQMLVEASDSTEPADRLRLALLSGDWIPITLPGESLRVFPRTKLVSLGGATEASIWSIFHPIDRVDGAWKSIPYGRPLANQTFYVLDGGMEFCPLEVEGELYIGGAGLSSGYFKDQEKTEAAFIEHPRLGRLYRTGDWGRWRDGGVIEFLGRKDQQVKIRGFRVELGEIESQLLKHPSVKQAVVLDKTDENGNRRLRACIVLKSSVVTDP